MVPLLMTEILSFTTIEEKKKVLATKKIPKRQNDQNGQNTLAQFSENCKKVKIEVKGPRKVIVLNVFR